LCPKVSAQYKIEVKGKIVESALIAFSKYGYDEVKYMGIEYYVIKEENILAVIN